MVSNLGCASAMHRLSQDRDLLGSDGPGYPHDALRDSDTLPTYWHNVHADMSYIDPRLRSSPSLDTDTKFHYQRPCETQRSYDLSAHGFSPRPLQMNTDSVLPQMGVLDPGHQDLDHFRHLRHISPTDPLGFSLSSNTDTSVSDYALSPDVARSSQDLPLAFPNQSFVGNSIAMPSATLPIWSPQTPFVLTLPSPPAPTDHTVQGMRHLQVTPDPEPEHEDVLMDDKNAFQSRINLPEEVEITEQPVGPPDSGLGQSVDDDNTMKNEEEESVMVESDNDSEFSPRTKSFHRQSSTTIRHSTRPPRAVLDLNARVTKTSHVHGAANSSNPRAKSKKKPPVTKKSNTESKSFPCAFHHYGCCATFANKNEWKRHVSSQHLQLGYFRCDMDLCADYHKGFNDFNRKDLFTQHCRRMHAPWSGTKKGEDGVSKKDKESFEKQLDIIRARCWVDRRKAPQKTKCGFCGKRFVDSKESKGWDERMEHLGRHYERDNARAEDENVDDGLRQWAINEGVVVEGRRKGEFWLPGFEPVQGSRESPGQRRSKRFSEDEVVENENMNGHATHKDDNTANDDKDASIEVKRAMPTLKAGDSSEIEDAEPDSEIDAEAEDDE